jgi:FkbM family methyltransferase
MFLKITASYRKWRKFFFTASRSNEKEIKNIKLINCKFSKSISSGDPLKINDRLVSSKSITYGKNTFEFFYRPDSTGDAGVIRQIFDEGQYEFGWLAHCKLIYKIHNDIINRKKKPLIIDAGANIGASSLWFEMKFKGAFIVAIEPNINNCKLMEINCANKDVVIFEGGLADKERLMYLQDPGGSDWGFRVGEVGESRVDCIGVADVLGCFDSEVYEPMILKIDIEGGESTVFEGACDWMKLIPMIVIELHDWMMPGKQVSKNFLSAIVRHGFEIITRGENVMCFNPKIFGKKVDAK